MSVIIRLQNLPWSANALDIRQYFKGLSIPEGGVHIVGGEMGDAFIAFSTDEDARQAMMKDRGKLNEVQIRLLLSSRTEMQKVIETARQQSLLALQKAGALSITPAVVAQTSGALPVPQPPVITTNSLQNILGTQLGAAPSFQTYQQQAGITLIPPSKSKQSDPDSKASNRHEGNESVTRDRRRSTSRDRRRSRSRDRNDRSGGKRRRDRSRSRSRERERDRDRERERERERDRKGNRQRSSRRSRSRERSRDRSRERGRNSNRSNRNSKDSEMTSNNRLGRESTVKSGTKNADPRDPQSGKAIISPWSVTPMNAYETNSAQNVSLNVATQLQKPNSLNPFSTNSAMGVGPNISNAYTTSSSVAAATMAAKTDPDTKNSAITTMIPPFHSYSTTTSNTNNYSINILSNPLVASTSTNSDAAKPTFALFNPYTAALRVSTSNSNSQDSNSSSTFNANAHENQTTFPGLVLDKNVLITPQQVAQLGADSKAPSNMAQVQQQQAQQPIAFANTNPYAQIYPSLFAQAAAAGTGIANPTRTNSQNQPSSSQDTKLNQRAKGNQKSDSENSEPRSCSIKISNMCTGTTYSDLRKFFSGLFIPHNGIKMINDRSGARTGVAYIQFSRSSCVSKAMVRNNTFLKTKRVSLEVVPDEEFKSTEDSYKPSRDRESFNRYDRHEPSTAGDSGGRGGDNRFEYGRNSPPHSKPDMGFGEDGNTTNPFSGNESSRGRLTVLHIEAIPAMATEHDIMKMFSAYTIFDILLTESPGNRKEFTAYVQFSREDEARAALAENSRHLIGNRIVRIRPAREEDMQKAKEKLRLASEQLKKEETRDDLGKRNNIGCDDTNGDQDTGENNDPNGTLSSGNTANIVNDFTGQGDIKCPQDGPSDPRLRRLQNNCTLGSNVDAEVDTERKDILSRQNAGPQQHNVPDFSQNSNPPPFKPVPMGSIENNFVILKNCDYGTHINDVAQLMLSAKLDLKHIEPLYNDRQMPTGEFIVEFTNSDDAATAAKRFNNTQFRNRNLRVRSIQPQEIADRMRKPFMNYFPGGRFPPHPMAMRGNFDLSGRGGGGAGFMPHFRMNGGYMGDAGDRSMGPMPGNHINVRGRGGDGGGSRMLGSVSRRRGGMRRHFAYPDQDVNMEDNFDEQGVDNDENAAARSDAEEDVVSVSSNSAGKDSVSGIPEKFNRPGCVIALENVPFKAELKDIVQFFGEFGVTEDDIIRRFNDDGTATGDARVAFATPAKARAAYESKRHKSIFKRTIYLSIV